MHYKLVLARALINGVNTVTLKIDMVLTQMRSPNNTFNYNWYEFLSHFLHG